jgi:Amt family ammonium transporter
MLGAASGAVAGLVVITPACGTVGPIGSIVMGLIGGVAGLWGVSALKRWHGIDDSLDAFGVHGVCGIVGALLTAVFTSPALGGTGNGKADFSVAHQLWVQSWGVLTTVVVSAVVAFLAYKIAGALTGGLRVSEEEEREGLDVATHGETAYRL